MNVLLSALKLSDRKRAVLAQILDSDQADRIMAESEAKILAERRELIARIEAAPGKYAKAKAAAEKRCAAAYEALDEALAAVSAARSELNAANSEVLAARCDETEIMDARKRLWATADPRLDDAKRELWTLHSRVKMQWVPAFATERNGFGGGQIIDISNMSDCKVAWAVLKAAIDQVEAMMLAAVSRAEVTKALQEITASTRKPLEVIGLRTFALDPESEVVATPYWGNSPRLAAIRVDTLEQ